MIILYYHVYDRCLQDEVDNDAVEFTNQNECSEDKLLEMMTALGVDFNEL